MMTRIGVLGFLLTVWLSAGSALAQQPYWDVQEGALPGGARLCVMSAELPNTAELYFKVLSTSPDFVIVHIGRDNTPPIALLLMRIDDQSGNYLGGWRMDTRQVANGEIAETTISREVAGSFFNVFATGSALSLKFPDEEDDERILNLTGAPEALARFSDCARRMHGAERSPVP